MARNRLTLTIRPFDDQSHDVEFSEFVPALDAIRRSLSNTEAIASNAKPTLDWRVVDLSHSSPATITIECSEQEKDLIHVDYVVEKYIGYWNAIVVEERIPDEIPTDFLGPFRELTGKVKDKKLRISISNGTVGSRVEISEKSDVIIDYALSDKYTTEGSIKGRLEAVNFHGSKFHVRIYPKFGPSVVRGIIPKNMSRQTADALEHYVIAHGTLTYLKRDKFASSIEIEALAILDNEPLLNLNDIKGIMPDMTGELSAEEFVRGLRDAE